MRSLARQIVRVQTRQSQSIVDIQIRNTGFCCKTQWALAVTKNLKQRLVEAAIRIANGPIVFSNAQLLQKLKRTVDLRSLRFR